MASDGIVSGQFSMVGDGNIVAIGDGLGAIGIIAASPTKGQMPFESGPGFGWYLRIIVELYGGKVGLDGSETGIGFPQNVSCSIHPNTWPKA